MDSISLIRTPIEAELGDFKELFDSSLSSSNALLDSVVSHIRQRNGKMMRPILVLLVARLYGAICPSTLHAAVSLELLHTASLVHDDVVDESSERRGQLSVNAIFNNKVAVLTGESNVAKIDFADFVDAMAGLVTAVFIVLTCNIVTGIMIGFATLVIGRLVSGEWRKLNIGTVVIAVALVTFYAGGWAI